MARVTQGRSPSHKSPVSSRRRTATARTLAAAATAPGAADCSRDVARDTRCESRPTQPTQASPPLHCEQHQRQRRHQQQCQQQQQQLQQQQQQLQQQQQQQLQQQQQHQHQHQHQHQPQHQHQHQHQQCPQPDTAPPQPLPHFTGALTANDEFEARRRLFFTNMRIRNAEARRAHMRQLEEAADARIGQALQLHSPRADAGGASGTRHGRRPSPPKRVPHGARGQLVWFMNQMGTMTAAIRSMRCELLNRHLLAAQLAEPVDEGAEGREGEKGQELDKGEGTGEDEDEDDSSDATILADDSDSDFCGGNGKGEDSDSDYDGK